VTDSGAPVETPPERCLGAWPATDEARIAAVRAHLLRWFDENGRDLPWRRTRDPYRILVSEVMLQQTQVDRVIPYYEAFLERFPTAEALAAAPTGEVIRLWKGLGYNRRAVNLQRTARAVVEEHGGTWPRDVASLRKLPGIGPYTAGAVACFAFEQDVPFIDTNMRRVLHRLFFGPDLPVQVATDREILEIADAVVPPGRGWAWSQALIEFGALLCTARKPACVVCPLQRECRAFPAILGAIAATPKGTRKKNEGAFEGSNRWYRARVVDALREAGDDDGGLDLRSLGGLVREGFVEEDLPWLRGVVGGLARDGLLALREDAPEYDAADPGALRVSLPD
jgi:A/G-specific adenine glycosylase